MVVQLLRGKRKSWKVMEYQSYPWVLRFDLLADKVGVPIVPFFKAGVNWYLWWVLSGGKTAKSVGGKKANLGCMHDRKGDEYPHPVRDKLPAFTIHTPSPQRCIRAGPRCLPQSDIRSLRRIAFAAPSRGRSAKTAIMIDYVGHCQRIS